MADLMVARSVTHAEISAGCASAMETQQAFDVAENTENILTRVTFPVGRVSPFDRFTNNTG
jgi:hypothetical protein